MFGDCLFTYIVGPQKRQFLVHEDVVSKASPALQAHMTVPMSEKENRLVELPEVDPDTFQCFLSYAYFHASHVCFSLKSTDVTEYSKSKVIELLLSRGQKQFRCKCCSTFSQLKFSPSFPRCQKCSKTVQCYRVWNQLCVRPTCSNTAAGLDGLLCQPCLGAYGAINSSYKVQAEKIQLQHSETLNALKWFRFDITPRAEEIALLMEQTTCGYHLPCDGLLEVTRLAIFANIYNIDALLDATCLALYKMLAVASLDDGSIENILEVAKIIYENTPDTEMKPFEEKHILRRMISEFIASRLECFTSPQPVEAFVGQKGDLYLDVLSAAALKCGEAGVDP